MYQISNDNVYSIKRVITSNKLIINTHEKGVKVLTINDLKSNKYSLQHILDNNDKMSYSDSLGLLVYDSHIIVSAIQY
jgi:hypothetical protein